jgi:carbamoyl-phosphate synthase/aspartate carbamoyltransferase/dihydroorotase
LLRLKFKYVDIFKATLITPPIDINDETLERIRKITCAIASALQVNGPFNLQLIAKDNQLKVIECNLRVSRSFPFVSKVLDYDFIAVATQVAMGLHPLAVDCTAGVGRVGVKVPQFSFSRLTGSDVLLGVEMVSTGEVACFGENKYEAYLKALMSTGFRIPKKNILLSIGSYKEKMYLMDSIKTLEILGYNLYASRGTADFYSEHNIKVEAVDWHYEDNSPVDTQVKDTSKSNGLYKMDEADSYLSKIAEQQRTVADYLMSNHFDMIINIPMKSTATLRASSFTTQGYHTRRIAINYSVPLVTNSKNVKLLVASLKSCGKASPIFKPSIDCLDTMKYIRLPGLIDVHVHLREPGGEHKEDILTGTSAALAGGYTMVLAMPNTNPPLIDEKSLELIEKIYQEKAVCDYGLYFGATADNAVHVSSLASRACGLKMYLNETFNALKLDKMDDWLMHFQNWPHEYPICCHAEEQSLAAILFLCELFDRHVHICHLSSKADVYLIKMAKEKGLKVTCEVAPHHLFFNDSVGQTLGDDLKQVRPRLKAEEDRKALWDNFEIIDMIASDHAPHTLDEKLKLFSPGFPGLETSLPLMITAYKQGKISLDTLVQKCYTNPKKIFNLPDQPNTYIEVGELILRDLSLRVFVHILFNRFFFPSRQDIDTEWTIPKAMPFSKCKWTPFAGMKVYGIVKRVTYYGEVVFVDGKVLSKAGCGKNIASIRSSNLSISRPKSEISAKSLNKTYRSSQSKLVTVNEEAPANDSYPTDSTIKHVRTRSSCSFSGRLLQLETPILSLRNQQNLNLYYFRKEQEQYQTQTCSDAYTPSEPTDGSTQLFYNINQILISQNGFYGSHIISVDLFKKDNLHQLFNMAHHLRTLVSTDKDLTSFLRGKIMAEMFYEPSTRTQCSFAAAMQRLGGSVIYMDEKHSSVKKGETLDDSVRMMSSYSDCIVIRHPEPGAADLAMRFANVPVLNAGDGTGEHPTQALLDVFTIREEIGTVNGITITIVGDLKHGRTVHSLAKLLRLYRVKIQYVAPKALKMPDEIVNYLKKYNIEQEEFSSLEMALPSTDVRHFLCLVFSFYCFSHFYLRKGTLHDPRTKRKIRNVTGI